MGKYPSDWDTRRQKTYNRDNYTCQNCGRKGGIRGDAELHAHHIVPVSSGGSHQLSNLKTLCAECHSKVHPHLESNGVSPNSGTMPHNKSGPDWSSSKGLKKGREISQDQSGARRPKSKSDTSTGSEKQKSSNKKTIYNEHMEPTGKIQVGENLRGGNKETKSHSKESEEPYEFIPNVYHTIATVIILSVLISIPFFMLSPVLGISSFVLVSLFGSVTEFYFKEYR